MSDASVELLIGGAFYFIIGMLVMMDSLSFEDGILWPLILAVKLWRRIFEILKGET